MQGRANKASKKELVIESPKQYKTLPVAEAEVEAVQQVVVSPSNVLRPLNVYIVWKDCASYRR